MKEEQKEKEGQAKPSDSPTFNSQAKSGSPEALKDITENIVRDLTSEDPTVKSVALKGKWGVGKTHYVEKCIQKHIEKIPEKKFIYVSLWGKKSVHDIETELLGSVLKFISNRKQIVKDVPGLVEQIFGVGISIKKLVGWGEEIWREMTVKNIGKNHILCFDDFERLDKKLRNDFLGWMNHFTEHQHVKVLLVFNDEKLDREQMEETGRTKHYREYFEKAVDIEYEYVPDKNSQVDIVFGDDEKHNAIKEYLKQEVALKGMTNIRIFQKIKLYWQKVFEILNPTFNSVQQRHWINDRRGGEVMTAVVYQCEELFNKDINRATKEQNILHQVRKLLASHSYYHDIAKLIGNGYLSEQERQNFIDNIKNRIANMIGDQAERKIFNFLRGVSGSEDLSQTAHSGGFYKLISLYYFNAFLSHVIRNEGKVQKYIDSYIKHLKDPDDLEIPKYNCDNLLTEESAETLHPALKDRLKSIPGKISPTMTIDDCVLRLIAQSHTPQDIRFLRLQVMEDFFKWLNHSMAMSQQDNGQNLISVRTKIAVLKGETDIEVPKDVREKFAEALREIEKRQ